ncbi:hypothetical protein NDU88_006132 [Pleurodeles waltl]|uniref:Uncharacterized protein n=1 Tax=Pleurodeles waltl TaxID=8319 RepID=A0AAV7QK86_PLEWA|nr:hypothetical protein NDU88_006132 [Pleurodeles waltl]
MASILWLAVTDKLTDLMSQTDFHTIASCLLGLYRRRKVRGAAMRFRDLAMLMTPRLIAMRWKAVALPRASREEAQKIPEPTRRSNPKGQAPQDHKSPGPDPDVEPTTVTGPAPPPETSVSVVPTHPEGTSENGAQTNAPPLEAQGEPEPTPGTKAEEGRSLRLTPGPRPQPQPL